MNAPIARRLFAKAWENKRRPSSVVPKTQYFDLFLVRDLWTIGGTPPVSRQGDWFLGPHPRKLEQAGESGRVRSGRKQQTTRAAGERWWRWRSWISNYRGWRVRVGLKELSRLGLDESWQQSLVKISRNQAASICSKYIRVWEILTSGFPLDWPARTLFDGLTWGDHFPPQDAFKLLHTITPSQVMTPILILCSAPQLPRTRD